jgi:hypothetical protein
MGATTSLWNSVLVSCIGPFMTGEYIFIFLLSSLLIGYGVSACFRGDYYNSRCPLRLFVAFLPAVRRCRCTTLAKASEFVVTALSTVLCAARVSLGGSQSHPAGSGSRSVPLGRSTESHVYYPYLGSSCGCTICGAGVSATVPCMSLLPATHRRSCQTSMLSNDVPMW